MAVFRLTGVRVQPKVRRAELTHPVTSAVRGQARYGEHVGDHPQGKRTERTTVAQTQLVKSLAGGISPTTSRPTCSCSFCVHLSDGFAARAEPRSSAKVEQKPSIRAELGLRLAPFGAT